MNFTPLVPPTDQTGHDNFSTLAGPVHTTTTPVSEADVTRVRSFFERALDNFHLAAPSVIFTQILNPTLAKIALSSDQYADRVTISPEEMREFVVTLIFNGPNSPESYAQTDRIRKAYDSLDVSVTEKDLSFLAYSLTSKFMQALQEYGGVGPSKEEQESWFRVISLATERLGTTEITDDYQTFVSQQQEVERSYLAAPSRASIEIAKEALSQFAKPLPFAIRPFAKPALLSVLSVELREALELPEISPSKQEFYRSILQKIGKLLNVRDVIVSDDRASPN